MIAELPKWIGRYLVVQRQADVSVDRLAELLPTPDRRGVVAPTTTWLRHGPAAAGACDPGALRIGGTDAATDGHRRAPERSTRSGSRASPCATP